MPDEIPYDQLDAELPKLLPVEAAVKAAKPLCESLSALQQAVSYGQQPTLFYEPMRRRYLPRLPNDIRRLERWTRILDDNCDDRAHHDVYDLCERLVRQAMQVYEHLFFALPHRTAAESSERTAGLDPQSLPHIEPQDVIAKWAYISKCFSNIHDVAIDDWAIARRRLPSIHDFHFSELGAELQNKLRRCNLQSPPNHERDKWLYDRRRNGDTYKELRSGLKKHPEWDQIDSDPGISSAIKRYAKRHNVAVPKHKAGRPKSKRSGA